MSMIKTVWTSHLETEKEREDFRKTVESDLKRDSYDRLRTIILSEIQAAENVTRNKYDNPSWAYIQAHTNGYNEAMRLLLSLIAKSTSEKK